jgi:hypothetical protein
MLLLLCATVRYVAICLRHISAMQISNAGKIQATNTLAKAQIAGTDLQAQPNAIGCLCVASRCVTGKQGVYCGTAEQQVGDGG